VGTLSTTPWIGWFQKTFIPIPPTASRNSEGGGGVYIDWNSEDIRGFQESNFQFGVVKSLKDKLIQNDLSKDDDSLVNTRHI